MLVTLLRGMIMMPGIGHPAPGRRPSPIDQFGLHWLYSPGRVCVVSLREGPWCSLGNHHPGPRITTLPTQLRTYLGLLISLDQADVGWVNLPPTGHFLAWDGSRNRFSVRALLAWTFRLISVPLQCHCSTNMVHIWMGLLYGTRATQ